MGRVDVTEGWAVPGFTLVRELGADASGRQILAVDELTRTQVTIRYLAAAVTRDDAFKQRIGWLSQLEDDNLVQVYELVENGAEAAVVGEHFEGVTLRRLLSDPLDPESAVVVLSDVLLGLAAAHAKGVVHGDCTPDRILLAPDGRAKLDGLCLAVSRGKGAPAGDPAYLAPERWQGSPQSPQADIYAATAVFVECLTGKRPFPGTSANALAKAHANAPVPVADLPGPLRPMVLRGLAKEPAKRPATAADFLAELDEAVSPVFGQDWEKRGRARVRELAHRVTSAPAASPAPARPAAKAAAADGSSGRSRKPLVLVGALAVVGALVGGGVYALNSTAGGTGADPEPTTALPTAVATVPSLTPAPTPTPVEPDGPELADRIEDAATAKGTVGITFKRVAGKAVTSANGGAKLDGTDLKVSLTGPRPLVKRPAIVVGDVAYVQVGAVWQKFPLGARAAGYGLLAGQTRWGASLESLQALLNGTEALTRKGSRYTGTVTSASFLGPVAPGYRKAKAVYELVVGDGDLPRSLKVTISAPGKPKITTWTQYSNWGGRLTVKAPR